MELTSLSGLSIRLSCGFRPKYCAAAFVAGRLWWSHWSVELGHAACIWGYLVQPLRGNLKLVYVGSQPMGMLLVVGYRGSCAPKADFASLLELGCNQGWTPRPAKNSSPVKYPCSPTTQKWWKLRGKMKVTLSNLSNSLMEQWERQSNDYDHNCDHDLKCWVYLVI